MNDFKLYLLNYDTTLQKVQNLFRSWRTSNYRISGLFWLERKVCSRQGLLGRIDNHLKQYSEISQQIKIFVKRASFNVWLVVDCYW